MTRARSKVDKSGHFPDGSAGRPAAAHPGSGGDAASPVASQSRPAAIPRLAGLLFVTFALVFLLADIGSVATQADPSLLLERQRFGFVVTSDGWRTDFDVARMRAGWYVDFDMLACGASPEGMDRAAGIQIGPGTQVNPDYLGLMVDNHPGMLWLIGNEPDCIWQGNVLPEEYAHIYHDFYTFIKDRDITSQVAPGGIVQATPLRLQWLDRVLQEYERAYSETMPVDVWNIHNAIVNEHIDEWGANIPPGITATQGVRLSIDENDRIDIFKAQIWTFREWMAANGYGGKPLIISEFGVLMPVEFGLTPERVNNFMDAAFEFMLTAADEDLGDPNDGYRLVQRWAWFSLDWPAYDPAIHFGFNGNLFDPETTAITGYGLNFASHTSAFPALEHVDLNPGSFWSPPTSSPDSPTGTMTRTFHIEVRNEGSLDSGPFTVELEYDGPVSGVLDKRVGNVALRSSHWITFTLSALEQGKYDLSMRIDRDGEVIESTECNNELSSSIAVPPNLTYLPDVVGGVH